MASIPDEPKPDENPQPASPGDSEKAEAMEEAQAEAAEERKEGGYQ